MRLADDWPPYAPPYIAMINTWMKPDEIIASDMPWAVAWYADRRAVWRPDSIPHFNELNDYKLLGGTGEWDLSDANQRRAE